MQEAERMGRLVTDLLQFSRRGARRISTLDLIEEVERTLDLVSSHFSNRHITVVRHFAPGLPPVQADRQQLRQVLLNLLTNASYALASQPEGAERRIAVRLRAGDGRVVLTVKDNGPGIPRETAARIFDPFFTTKPPGEGTGLGLFLSFGIAESHGGTLSVSSEPGYGAAFSLTIPTADAGAVTEGARPPARTSQPGPARRRVLVVDDDPVMRRLVTVLFNHDGHDVDQAESGGDGLELARQHAYDLVIADRRAAAGGETFVSALCRERPAWQSRIIISAADRPGLPGVEDVSGMRLLKKPFNLRDLRMAAGDVWTENRGWKMEG